MKRSYMLKVLETYLEHARYTGELSVKKASYIASELLLLIEREGMLPPVVSGDQSPPIDVDHEWDEEDSDPFY